MTQNRSSSEGEKVASGIHPFVSEKFNKNGKPTGIWSSIPETANTPSHATKLHPYVVSILGSYRITKPIAMFLRALWLEHSLNNFEPLTVPFDKFTFANLLLPKHDFSFVDDVNFLRDHRDEMYALATGCTVARGYRGDKLALIDIYGNITNEAKSIVELIINDAYMKFNMQEDYWSGMHEVTEIEHILFNNGIQWPEYTVLWDAVHNDEFQNIINRRNGTLKDNVIEELAITGLGLITLSTKELNSDGSLNMGRPYKMIKPTYCGRRLISLCDAAGYTFPNEARLLSRKNQHRPAPAIRKMKLIEKEFRNLGLNPPDNLEDMVEKGVTPARIKREYAAKQFIELNKPKEIIDEVINEVAIPKTTTIPAPKTTPIPVSPLPTTNFPSSLIIKDTAEIMVEFRERSKVAKDIGIDAGYIFQVKQKLATSDYEYADIKVAIDAINQLIQTHSQPQEEFVDENIEDAPQGEYYDDINIGGTQVKIEKWGPPEGSDSNFDDLDA